MFTHAAAMIGKRIFQQQQQQKQQQQQQIWRCEDATHAWLEVGRTMDEERGAVDHTKHANIQTLAETKANDDVYDDNCGGPQNKNTERKQNNDDE